MGIKVVIRKKANEWEDHGETIGLNSSIDCISFQFKLILPVTD